VDRVIPLERLKNGQSAEVTHIDGPAEHVHRLEEFGLRSGCAIQMFRSGNPCILCMAGGKFCLRPDELLKIFVKRSNGRG